MTEVLLTDFTPHPTNTRAACAEAAEKYADREFLFGIEQEYTFFRGNRPLGFPKRDFPHHKVATTAVLELTRSLAATPWRRIWMRA